MTSHVPYMIRCLELAAKAAGKVAPNPMVGAVLVYEDRIIGEGFHEHYGEAHAEVNCLASVKDPDRPLISQSTLYVSLEPCAHYGKTPPCADLIIKHHIPRVVVGCRDPFKEVDGKGIERLMAAGIEVIQGVCEKECKELNKRFLTFHTAHRPYVILKWAQTADDKIAAVPGERLFISSEITNRLVHKWRSEEASILVGTNTALLDDPELTTRLWPGPSPVRLVVDRDLSLPSSLKVFNRQVRTIIFNTIRQEEDDQLLYYQITEDVSPVHQILHALYQLKIQSVMVEGGARVLQSFIDEGIWDEIRIIKNEALKVNSGLAAPAFADAIKVSEEWMITDKIEIFKPKS